MSTNGPFIPTADELANATMQIIPSADYKSPFILEVEKARQFVIDNPELFPLPSACYKNSIVGNGALQLNTTGSNNTAIGDNALYSNTTGSNNTAIGNNANYTGGIVYTNNTCLGANSIVSGSNQVQLGDNQTTTYCCGAVQNRSDVRDKTDIIDTQLGLDFINKLRPVDFRWDYRQSYTETVIQDGKPTQIKHTSDGSKKRNRYHHGLIAQEVKDVMTSMNIDFGGYQDHSVNGGEDVLTIGYVELITPMIKAIQEMNTKIQELTAIIQEMKK
jgi:hypothetical protein